MKNIKVGSSWLHKNGIIYTVICVANTDFSGVSYSMQPGDCIKINKNASDDRRDEYPELLLVIDKDRRPIAVEPLQITDLVRGKNVPLSPFVIYRGESGEIWGKTPEGFLRSRTPLEDKWGSKSDSSVS